VVSTPHVAVLNLVLAASSFIGLHAGVAGTPLRAWLVARSGERAFRAVFAASTLAVLVWLTRSYSSAYAMANTFYWAPAIAQHISAPIILCAVFLAVPGLTTGSPTLVGQARVLERDPEAHGIQRITRHPFLCGVVIWSSFHIFANGDTASLILFGTFWIVALNGMFSIDRKRARALGPLWTRYAEQTSILPFAAIARGKNRFVWREIGWWRVLLTLTVFAVLVTIHPWLFHAYPMPGMDD
jgi:uncharacterized membrane protein